MLTSTIKSINSINQITSSNGTQNFPGTSLFSSNNDMNDILDKTKNIKEMVFTVSIPLNWEIDTVNGGYFQTVYVDGILEEDNPTVDIVLGYDVNTNTSQLQSYGCITKIITAKNYITLYADNNIPTSEFTIKMKVVR